MQAHPIRRQAIRRRGLAEARSAEAVAPERGVRGTYKLSPERRAKGGLGCPVSHPEHGDTLISFGIQSFGKPFGRGPDDQAFFACSATSAALPTLRAIQVPPFLLCIRVYLRGFSMRFVAPVDLGYPREGTRKGGPYAISGASSSSCREGAGSAGGRGRWVSMAIRSAIRSRMSRRSIIMSRAPCSRRNSLR